MAYVLVITNRNGGYVSGSGYERIRSYALRLRTKRDAQRVARGVKRDCGYETRIERVERS